ncbi:MAG: FkbM family methyltransferase [Pyrinomonadaceae bacterium]
MNITKIRRIPKRIKDDLFVISLVANWSEILVSKLKGSNFNKIFFRNGLTLEAPEQIRLDMLFHEVWVEKMYSPQGFEIKDNNIIFDIGANIGVFSVYAAKKAKNVKVFAFEPFPDNVKWLQKNIKNNKLNNVVVSDKAVAGKSEQRTLEVSDAWVRHSLNENNKNNGIKINTLSLDEIFEEIEVCDLMKIDCEGSEYEIFYSSSKKTLAKIKKIVGEYHDNDNEKMNGSALCDFLTQNGFAIISIKSFGDSTGSFCAINKAG